MTPEDNSLQLLQDGSPHVEIFFPEEIRAHILLFLFPDAKVLRLLRVCAAQLEEQLEDFPGVVSTVRELTEKLEVLLLRSLGRVEFVFQKSSVRRAASEFVNNEFGIWDLVPGTGGGLSPIKTSVGNEYHKTSAEAT